MHDLRAYKVTKSTIDRSFWPCGPWDHEPDEDRAEFHGLPCWFLRMESGHWCGYVGVEKTNPYAEQLLDKENLSVHGGITFAKASKENDLFWLGFDCYHSEDLVPTRLEYAKYGHVYRTLEYVKQEAERLAEQLASAKVELSPTPFLLSPKGYHLLSLWGKDPWGAPDDLLQRILVEITPAP